MKLNFRFLIPLLVVSMLAGVGVFCLHRFQVSRTSNAVVSMARQAKEAGQLSEAQTRYQRYLGLMPEDAAARSELGEILALGRAWKAAFFQLEQALRIDPELTEARENLVRVSLTMQRHQDAVTHLTEHLIPSDPDNAEYRWLLGQCYFSLGRYSEARGEFERAVQSAPEDPSYASALAGLLSEQLEDPAAAREVFSQLVKHAPQDSQAYIQRGRWLLFRSGRLANDQQDRKQSLREAAWADAQQAVELDPTGTDAVIFAVEVALQMERGAELKELVAMAIQANPQQADLYRVAAQIEIQAGNEQQARKVLQVGLTKNTGSSELMWLLAQLESNAERWDAVERLIEQLKAVQYPEASVRFLQAQMLAAHGQWRQTIELLDKSRAFLSRDKDLLQRTDFILAECYRRLGKPDQQISALRRAVDANPLWQRGRERLAAALLGSGKLQESLVEYRTVVSQPDPSLSAVLALARLTLLDSLANATENQVDWQSLESILGILEKYPEAEVEVAVLRAEVAFAKGAEQEAIEVLEQQREATPASLPLHRALIALHLRGDRWDEASEVLKAAEQTLPDSPELRLERARFLLRRRGQEVPLDQLDAFAKPDRSWSEEQRVALANGFASLFMALEQLERCEQQAQIVANSEIGQTDLTIRLLIFDLAFRTRDIESMLRSLDHVKQIEGVGPLWRVGEAVRLSVQAEKLPEEESSKREEFNRRALEQLSEAALERPKWSRIPRLRGEIYDRQEQPKLAIEQYLNAIELGEQDPELIAQTVARLAALGRFSEADQVVRKLQRQQTPFTSNLTKLASQVSLQMENFDRALELARDWAEESKQQEDRIWLAQVYGISGDLEQAEKEFRQAIEIDPTAAEAWVPLVQMQARMGKIDRAKETLAQATAAVDVSESADALAQAYEAVGETDLALKYCNIARQSRPEDSGVMRRLAALYLRSGQTAGAKPLLEQLVSTEGPAETADRTWARRNLAIYFALERDGGGLEQVKELLAANEAEIGRTDNDRRTLAIAYAAQKDATATLQAILILEDLVEKQFSLQDQFLLAELFARQDDWTRYSRAMRILLSQAGAENPMYVRKYARALLEHGEIEEARLWTNRLKQVAAEQVESDSLEAQLLFQSNDYQALLQLLKSRAERTDGLRWAAATASYYGAQLQRSGSADLGGEFLGQAQLWLTRYVESNPADGLVLAQFHARHGQIQQCVEQINQQEATPEQLAAIADTAIESRNLSEPKAKLLLTVLQPALEASPQNIRLALAVGDVQGWVGDWRSAMTSYQLVLQREPKNLLALNNMAFVLALTGQELNEAEKAITQALQQAGVMDALLDTRGSVRLAMGHPAEAEGDFRAALGSAASPSRMIHLAQALAAQGKLGEARAFYEQAMAAGLSAGDMHPLERPQFNRIAQQFGTASN